MKRVVKKLMILAGCIGLIVGSLAPIYAKGDIIRPYTFGFGDKNDVDEGVYDLVEAGDLKHLTFEDSKGHSINYWVHIPRDHKGKPIENLPLVMYMHGYSDGGGDNNIAIRYHNALLFKLIKEQDKPERQAIILVPQTPNAMNPADEKDWFKDQWVGIEPRDGEDKWTQWNRTTWNMDETPRTENLNTVVELMEKIQKDTKSDLDRAYVSGISMGGYTTWDLISRDDSHRFAAAVPICGVGDTSKVENMKDVPIKMFHGGIDPVINPDASRLMYKSLRKYGNVTYTEYADEEHPCWNSAYSPVLDDDKNGISNLDDLINWMFNQSRKGTLDGSVDKAPLTQIVNDAKKENKENYTNEEWNQLQLAIENANKVLSSSSDKNNLDKAARDLDESLIKNKTGVNQDTTKKENNSMGIVIGVISVIVIGCGIVFVVKRKK